MNKICFITLATGKYFNFTERLANSINDYFFDDADICVFTDCDDNHLDWIKYFKAPHLPWPQVTSCKFERILSQSEYFKQYDYIYQIDSDMVLCDNICFDEISPNENGLTGVKHPAWGTFMGPRGTIETRSESAAFIHPSKPLKCYFQGCFWGGRTEDVLRMCSVLKINTDYDARMGIKTIWDDESHLNCYFVNHPPRIIGSEYCCPEKDFERYGITSKKILHIHKNARGDNFNEEL